jgi:hypothetical protein
MSYEILDVYLYIETSPHSEDDIYKINHRISVQRGNIPDRNDKIMDLMDRIMEKGFFYGYSKTGAFVSAGLSYNQFHTKYIPAHMIRNIKIVFP